MKSHREQMIDDIVGEVDDWTIETLISWVKISLLDRYKSLSTNQIEEEYVSVFGVEDYPETFPEGYNEQ